jgi:hypothetical protein
MTRCPEKRLSSSERRVVEPVEQSAITGEESVGDGSEESRKNEAKRFEKKPEA